VGKFSYMDCLYYSGPFAAIFLRLEPNLKLVMLKVDSSVAIEKVGFTPLS